MDPWLLKLFKEETNDYEKFDYFRSDVFSLGLTLLRACSLESIKKCNLI